MSLISLISPTLCLCNIKDSVDIFYLVSIFFCLILFNFYRKCVVTAVMKMPSDQGRDEEKFSLLKATKKHNRALKYVHEA